MSSQEVYEPWRSEFPFSRELAELESSLKMLDAAQAEAGARPRGIQEFIEEREREREAERSQEDREELAEFVAQRLLEKIQGRYPAFLEEFESLKQAYAELLAKTLHAAPHPDEALVARMAELERDNHVMAAQIQGLMEENERLQFELEMREIELRRYQHLTGPVYRKV